jgi:hypothetical protein
VGESFTLPEACELVATVREPEPTEAVIVTEVAFVSCQANATLCPAVIVFVFAENTMPGMAGIVFCEETPLQPQSAKRATSTVPKLTLRRLCWFIPFRASILFCG